MEKKKTESGSKAYQREDYVECPECGVKLHWREDRNIDFLIWHRELTSWLYSFDIDQVEFRFNSKGHIMPVAIIELTRFDGNGAPPPSYLKKWLNRIHTRDAHAAALKQLSEMLFCDAYLVCWKKDLQLMWVFNLTTGQGWQQMTPAEYENWLKTLKSRHRPTGWLPEWFC